MMNETRVLLLIVMLSIGLAGCQTVSGDTTSGWSMKKSLSANFKGYGYQDRFQSRRSPRPRRG